MDIQTFLEVSRRPQKEIIKNWGLKGAKVSMVLHCTFMKINPIGKDSDENGQFHSGNHIITDSTDLVQVLEEMEEKIEDFPVEFGEERMHVEGNSETSTQH